jgi:hypothetical protein
MNTSLLEGELLITGRLVDASNATLLAAIHPAGDDLSAISEKVVYKPIIGERPLWDFSIGNLASRERAAYLLSELGEFHSVPETVLRDGPFGYGAVQRWVEVDPSYDILAFAQSQDPTLRNLALFDVVINNADRKFGHILIDAEGRLFGCDHGLSFHHEKKLRTVLWQFAGQELFHDEKNQLSNCLRALKENEELFSSLLTGQEIDATYGRIEELLINSEFPHPSGEWPAIPWPPF